jgi:hypothetical protein
MQYGHIIAAIAAGSQSQIQTLVTSPSDQITAVRHLIARGKVKSKPLLAQTERLSESNSVELKLSIAQGEGGWQDVFSVWLPSVDAFSRVDLVAELGCSPNEPFVLAPGYKLGVSGSRLAGSPTEDRVIVFGDWYQDAQELIFML